MDLPGNHPADDGGSIEAGDNPQPNFEPGTIYVGGLSRKLTLDQFVQYFSKYGEIKDQASVLRKRRHPKRTAFGFITFADPSVVDQVLQETHLIHGREAIVRRKIRKGGDGLQEDFRTNMISVCGIPFTVTEDELRDFFTRYGEVKDIKLLRDCLANPLPSIGLITYDSEETVDDLLAMGNKIEFAGVQVEIKKTDPTKQNPTPPVLSSHSSDSRSSHGGGYDAYNRYGRNYDNVNYWPGGSYDGLGSQVFRYRTDAGTMVAYRGDTSLGDAGFSPSLGYAGFSRYPSLGYAGFSGYPSLGYAGFSGYPSLGYAGFSGYPSLGYAGFSGYPSLGYAGAIETYRGDPSLGYAAGFNGYPSPRYAGAIETYRGDPSLGYAAGFNGYPTPWYAGAIETYRGDPSLGYAGTIETYRGDPSLGYAGAVETYRRDPSLGYAGGYDGDFGRGYALYGSGGTRESYGAYGGISSHANGNSYDASQIGAASGD